MTTRRQILASALIAPAALANTAPAEEEQFAYRIFRKINELRVIRGAPALIWSNAIASCAREQSLRKAKLRFPGHNDPERGDVAARLKSAGIRWARCGENLFSETGWDDPVNFAVTFWWYSTTGHQENLLTPEYTESAIGVVKADRDSFFVTQIFVTPVKA
jgi:uncharacterized protein YkwD